MFPSSTRWRLLGPLVLALLALASCDYEWGLTVHVIVPPDVQAAAVPLPQQLMLRSDESGAWRLRRIGTLCEAGVTAYEQRVDFRGVGPECGAPVAVQVWLAPLDAAAGLPCGPWSDPQGLDRNCTDPWCQPQTGQPFAAGVAPYADCARFDSVALTLAIP